MIFLELLIGAVIVGLVLYKGIQLQRGLGSAPRNPVSGEPSSDPAHSPKAAAADTSASEAN